MSNLVSLTCFTLEMLGKTQTEVFMISRFLGKSLPVKSNSRQTPESVMTLTVTIFDKKKKNNLKNITMTPCQQI